MADVLLGKKVALGVTGSIAAYKAAELTSRLVQRGAQAHVILTKNASQFVAPLTFRSLSGNPVYSDTFADPSEWRIEHIGLAEEADLILIAPASANAIAKLAAGLADELLYCIVLASQAPVLVAPAMDEGMYLHPATQANLQRLEALGYQLIAPESGWLASGKQGTGRLAAIEMILASVEGRLRQNQSLAGKTFLITAGPTREPVDPVRFLSNASTGKMGYALAAAAANRGAKVVLVSGPTHLAPPSGIELISVITTAEMHEATLARFPECDCLIAAAAPADFAPAETEARKIRKSAAKELRFELRPTPDILAEAGRRKERQVLIGFAAETNDLLPNARAKLEAKNLDVIVANDVTAEGAGFALDTNRATLISADGSSKELPLQSKRAMAEVILDEAEKLLKG